MGGVEARGLPAAVVRKGSVGPWSRPTYPYAHVGRGNSSHIPIERTMGDAFASAGARGVPALEKGCWNDSVGIESGSPEQRDAARGAARRAGAGPLRGLRVGASCRVKW